MADIRKAVKEDSQGVLKNVLALLVSCLLCGGVQGASHTHYQTLLVNIFNGYSSEVRPFLNDSVTTSVNLSLDLLSIVEVKEKDQALVTNARLKISWTDLVLNWTPSANANIKALLVPQHKIWRPDIVLGNPVSSQDVLGHKDLPIKLLHTGMVRWAPTDVFETSCAMDITYYPMDTQKCSIIFQPEMAGRNDIKLDLGMFKLNDFTENGQWELEEHAALTKIGANRVQVVEFQLKLRRRRFFYVLNVILPVVFLSLTSSLVFALPADAGEKMGLSITVLLAYAVYLTLVTDSMPNTSMQVSLMAVYLMMLLGLCAINVVFTAFILRLYHRHQSNSPPLGHRTSRLILGLRRWLFFPPPSPSSSDQNHSSFPSATLSPSSSPSHSYSAAATGISQVPISVEDYTSDGEGSTSKLTKTSSPALKSPGRIALIGFASRRVGDGFSSPSRSQDVVGHDRKTTGTNISSVKVTSTTSTDCKDQSSPDAAKRSPRKCKTPTACSLESSPDEGQQGMGAKYVVDGKVAAETLDFFLFVVCSTVSLGTTVLCLLTLIAGSATNAIDTSLA